MTRACARSWAAATTTDVAGGHCCGEPARVEIFEMPPGAIRSTKVPAGHRSSVALRPHPGCHPPPASRYASSTSTPPARCVVCSGVPLAVLRAHRRDGQADRFRGAQDPVHDAQRRRSVGHRQFAFDHDVADPPPPARLPVGRRRSSPGAGGPGARRHRTATRGRSTAASGQIERDQPTRRRSAELRSESDRGRQSGGHGSGGGTVGSMLIVDPLNIPFGGMHGAKVGSNCG